MKASTTELSNDHTEHGVPLSEHWEYLIKDESNQEPISQEVRSCPEIAKLRKYLIEFILQIGDRLKQRTMTMQIAVNYLDRLFMMNQLSTIK